MENKEFLTRDEAIVWMVLNPNRRLKDAEDIFWFYPFSPIGCSILAGNPDLLFRNPDYIPPKKPEPLTFEEAVERLKSGVPVLFLCPMESKYRDLSALPGVLQAWTIMRSLSDAGIPLYAENPEEVEG